MTKHLQKIEDAIAKNGAEKMRPRQDPLMALYTEVLPSKGRAYPVGVHKAVGGISDFATPGDLLCAAIAACLDSTIRIIANRMGVALKSLEVCVSGHVDVRGTLRVDDTAPVGFHKLVIEAKIEPVAEMPDAYLKALLKGAEQSCVVLQTIKHCPEVSLTRVNATPVEQTNAA